MTALRQKVFRDFRQERTRSLAVALAIALGIAAFWAVLASYAILTRELDRGYLATNPASATIRTEAVDEELLAALAANPQIAAVDARRTLSGRIKAGPVEWRNLTLFVIRDFTQLRVSTLAPQQGAWPPGPGEILIERDAVQVARARLGDSLLVRTAGGAEATLRFSGAVRDVGQAQARMENLVYGYITRETLAQLGEPVAFDQVKILVAGDRYDEAHIRQVAGQARALLEQRGKPVHRIDIPTPGKHPHSRIMGLLLLSMASFGLFVLLLSAILVVNLQTALMAAQIRQIGVMKALGGSRRRIAAIYLAQAGLLGGAALLLAAPLGLAGSRALCRYLAVFLNFDIESFAAPLWVYLLVILVGLLAPVLAAAWPVWKGTGVSVREALADVGVRGRAFGAGALDRAMAGIGGPVRPLLFAIRNSFRRRARLVLTMTTLTAGGVFFMAALNTRASLIHTLDRLFATRGFDLAVNLGGMRPIDKALRAADRTPGVRRAEGWFLTQATLPAENSSASADDHDGDGATRIGITALPANTALYTPDLLAGRALADENDAVLLINSALAESTRRPLRPGDTLTLRLDDREIEWRIVGIAREPFTPPAAYAPLRFLERQRGETGLVNSLRLALDATDRAAIARTRDRLDQNLEAEGIRAQGSSTRAENRFGFDQHMLMIYVFLIVMAAILALVGGLGLTTTMSLNVLERRRELGVLRALGASPATVRLLVVAEGVTIGFLSWLLAGALAWPLSRALGDLLVRALLKGGTAFSFALPGLWIWLAISLALGALGSFLPAWRASRRPIREALEYE